MTSSTNSRTDSRAVPRNTGGELIAHGAAHGSLGELWQGPVFHEGSWRVGLVTLPVSRHSYASFYATTDEVFRHQELTAKRESAIDLYLRRYGLELPAGYWRFTSDLPTGKGMSSSTADIVSIIRCLNGIFHRPEDPAATQSILRQIERSDAVHTDQYCLYLSGRHAVVRRYAAQIAFNVCYAYEDREIRTEDHPEEHLLAGYAESAEGYAHSLAALDTALTSQDSSAVAREATRSAELAQSYLPSPLVADLLSDHRDLGGVGVIRAHTGSVAGILLDTGCTGARRAALSRYFLSRGFRCYFTRGGYPLV